MMKYIFTLILGFTLALSSYSNEIPADMESLWKNIDPKADPLDVEIIEEWEDDGVVIKVIRLNVAKHGNDYFKVAAVYGYPKGQKNLPALLQIHGGGQFAHQAAVITNAKRGYATISLAWAGRLNSSKYNVRPNNVKVFWDNDVDNKDYRLTTDWLNVDAYHAPSRWGRATSSISPSEHTIDSVDSPRNAMWFLWTLAGRRALTFLEAQPEVNPDKLGVYGHSMGGQQSTLVAGSDSRVKAVAPSCGGVNSNLTKDALFNETLGDYNYLENIKVPMLFLSPANDFNGRLDDTHKATKLINTKDYYVVSSPHKSHQDSPNVEVATLLFFDDVLKDTFSFPASPSVKLNLSSKANVLVSIDKARKNDVKEVEIYFAQKDIDIDREDNKRTFWHYVKAMEKANGYEYTGEIPVFSKDKPLWVFANVTYKLDKEYSFAGYYYRTSSSDEMLLSSNLIINPAKDLGALAKPWHSDVILDSSSETWEKDFFSYDLSSWGLTTNKISDECFNPSAKDKLQIELSSKTPMKMVVLMSGFYKEISLEGTDKLEKFVLSATDFKNSEGKLLDSFENVMYLSFIPNHKVKPKGASKDINLGSTRTRDIEYRPSFKLVKWVR